MVLAGLLGDLTPDRFLADYYLKLPYASPGGAAHLQHLGGRELLERLAERTDTDLLLARAGRPYQGPRPDAARALRLHAEGWTLLVRHAERHDADLAALAGGLDADLGAPVNVHLYATPPGRTGFHWHCDAEEVFIIQTAGVKEYRLRRNTVHPWPVAGELPHGSGAAAEQAPPMTCTLHAGDWLYIPAGWWHHARAETEALSLAAGLMAPSGMDVLGFLVEHVRDSLPWRQRLPPAGHAAGGRDEVLSRYREHFRELARDLQDVMGDPLFVRRYLEARRNRSP